MLFPEVCLAQRLRTASYVVSHMYVLLTLFTGTSLTYKWLWYTVNTVLTAVQTSGRIIPGLKAVSVSGHALVCGGGTRIHVTPRFFKIQTYCVHRAAGVLNKFLEFSRICIGVARGGSIPSCWVQ